MKVKISEIKENPNNPRFIKDEKFKKLVKSIKDFPEMLSVREIVVDENMVVLGGNMRLKALKEAGIKEVEIKKVEGWTEDQKKEFVIKDNASFGSWDFDILANEWSDLPLEDWGLEIDGFGNEEDEEENEEIETGLLVDENILKYNEHAVFKTECKFEIPPLRDDMLFDGKIDDICFGGKDVLDQEKKYLILYGQTAIDEKIRDNVVGFFIDDERFEVVWNNAVSVLEKFNVHKPGAIMTPNFSIWYDEPLPFQIMSWYKTQWCGRYWQEAGHKIIPTINFGDKRSYDFCFSGIPKNTPVVSAQCRNLKTKLEKKQFIEGMNEAFSRINWGNCVIYGGEEHFDFLEKEIKNIPFQPMRAWQTKKKLEEKKQ